MRRVLIGGIGNVLLGDDGIGPYVVRLLESRYNLGEGVEVADLGTPALDLTHRIVGLGALILVDAVASDDPPGTIILYRKADIMRISPAQRLDPHSPALSECLLAADMLGTGPEHVLLVGVVAGSYEIGCCLSAAVHRAAVKAEEAILRELEQLGFPFQKRLAPLEPDIWWSNIRAGDSITAS